jgi:hypothetical protein
VRPTGPKTDLLMMQAGNQDRFYVSVCARTKSATNGPTQGILTRVFPYDQEVLGFQQFPLPLPLFPQVVVVSSAKVVVLASVVVVVGSVVVVGGTVVVVGGIVVVVVVEGIVGLGSVLVDVDVVDIPKLLVVEGWVVVTCREVVVVEPTVVDGLAAGASVDVVGPGGRSTPIPPALGTVVVTGPTPVVLVELAGKRPMNSSRFRVGGTPSVVVGLSCLGTSNESTCGGSADALFKSKSTPAKIPKTRAPAVTRMSPPDMRRPAKTLVRGENLVLAGCACSASRRAICLASSSGLGLRGSFGWGNGADPFPSAARPG